ncbi:ABC transporter ATP-binding protein [Caballeronia hypogeia]|uniref:ABC transporter ATP-binding protein n=1 Tax=Caballeronia hypogeia TaxID=1777140 RepID=A0A158BVF3_9BURK|nr:ABC transporter ATP-binding protein [Caballeronia hypogeia]
MRLSDRIAVFNKGRIEQCGTGEELYANPASKFVANFIGNSNFLPVRVTASSAEQSSGGTGRHLPPVLILHARRESRRFFFRV